MNMLKVTATLVFVYTVSLVSSAKITTEKDDYGPVSRDMMTSGSDQDGMKMDENTDKSPDLMGIMNECNDTFRIEMGYLEALNESGSFPDETDKTPKCYVRCVLEKTRIVSEDGVFDADMAAQMFAGERQGKQMDDIHEMTAACAGNRKESDKCVRSYMFMKCLMESEIKEYLKIM